MTEQSEKDRAEAKEKKYKKPIQYRRFERLLRQVVKAPPLRKVKSTQTTPVS
jgi:hypothetical protein